MLIQLITKTLQLVKLQRYVKLRCNMYTVSILNLHSFVKKMQMSNNPVKNNG